MFSLVFPGQGSQYIGMGKDFFENFKEAQLVFEEAEDVSQILIKKLCFEGPLEELTKTENLQVCITTVNIAIYTVFQNFLKEKEKTPLFVAGHSLGEYSALFASKTLCLKDVIFAVKKRGELMGKAGEKKPSAMYAIIGLPEKDLQEILNNVEGLVIISNYNSPSQLVISGEIPAVDKASELAKEKGAKKVVKLKVSAGFHSPLMKEAEKELASVLDNLEWHDPEIPFVSNVSAKPEKKADTIKELMKKQITSPVRWIDCVKTMSKQGTSTFIEIGPKKVLTNLIKQILDNTNFQLYNIDTLKDLKEVISKL